MKTEKEIKLEKKLETLIKMIRQGKDECCYCIHNYKDCDISDVCRFELRETQQGDTK